MNRNKPTVILRHRKENLKKCSLRGLEKHEGIVFYSYPQDQLPDLNGYLMLSLDGEPLRLDETHSGLFFLDATWRYAEKMVQSVEEVIDLPKRSLPKTFRTAYPRRQPDCPDQNRGLASVEALFIAYHILGCDTAHLLDNYKWKEEFLALNPTLTYSMLRGIS